MLKDLLQTWLASFCGSHKSVPTATNTETVLQLDANGNAVCQFIAPADGVATVQFLENCTWARIRKGDLAADWLSFVGDSAYAASHLPMAKGERLVATAQFARGESQTISVVVQFYKYIGES